MKQKKALSKEALAAMLGKTSEENASEESTETLTPEELAAAEAVKAEALKAEEEAEALKAEEAEALKAEEALKTEEALQAEIVTLKEEATATEVTHAEAMKAVETAANSLKEIAVDQISIMRMALKIAPVDMSAWDVAAVVTEFSTTKDTFVSSFPVGSVIPEKGKDEETEARVIATSIDSAAYKSLGFN